ncbi:MAG: acyl-CoA dehydrogenase [Salinisphaeraceae bacterium]|nr:acyl-CoA dehydrogenase [Salinisphaeraceae bacterium]
MELDADSLMIQDMTRRFAREVLAPAAMAWDRGEPLGQSVLDEMARLGLFGMLVPEAHGGSAISFTAFMTAIEEIAAGDGGISTLVHVHNLGTCAPIRKLANPAQQQQFLPAMARGEMIGAFCLTEPHTGSDAAAIRTRASRDGDHWVLNGSKQFVTNGKRAGLAIVAAVTDPEAGKHGISLFLVPTDTPGFTVSRVEEKLGQHVSDTALITLENCRVPQDLMMGERGRALSSILEVLADGRVSIAAQAVGMARAAFEHALAYARERTSFGKPIIEHQAVAFRLADMKMRIEVARQYVYHAAGLLDAGKPCLQEAAIAKLYAGEMAEKVCSDAIQIHGGYGYTRDFAVERIYRDVRVCQIYEGTNDIQRMLIARTLYNA